MVRLALALALGIGAAAPATMASAATEAECKEAIASLENAMSSNPAMEDNEGKAQEAESVLAQAGEAGLQGDHGKCMELVEEARGITGLR
ncbi:MAG: hypothetical protein AAGD34_11750 [Pseudomonadota bacterium]